MLPRFYKCIGQIQSQPVLVNNILQEPKYIHTFFLMLSTAASETEKQRYIVATGTVHMTSRAWHIYYLVLRREPLAVCVFHRVLMLGHYLGALK